MVKTKFSASWKRSKQTRKQRKYRHNAPLHIRQKFMHTHLSPELRKKYSFRNIQLRTGDKVKIMRGQFRKKDGKVERIDLKREKVFITGLERIKKEGTRILVSFNPSNLMITELNLNDKKRKQKVESKSKSEKLQKKETVKEETKETPKEEKKEEIKKETPKEEIKRETEQKEESKSEEQEK